MKLKKMIEWLFGCSWDAKAARKERDQKIAAEKAECERMTSKVYEDTLRQMAEAGIGYESRTEKKTMSVELADSLMISLSAIQMTRDNAIQKISKEYEEKEDEMAVKSKWFLPRLWMEWRRK